MIKGIQIDNMKDLDIDEAKKIWVSQYELHCKNKDFPVYWGEDTTLLGKFLHVKIKKGCAIAAKLDGKLVGFLAYDEFPFNGEASVFCPAIGHGAMEEYKESVYLELYRSISQEWVNRNVFNHMWTIFFNDKKLKSILFDVGYGSYLIDAFTQCTIEYNETFTKDIRKASDKDKHVLYELIKESNQYYAAAPLFLKRDELTYEEVEEIIESNRVFIAWDQETAAGFIHISLAEENNFINLSTKGSGLINDIGVYIKPEYRNKTLGLELLKTASDYGREAHAPHMHVDFETANLYGNRFWKKYFTPMLLSMRRTINKNINDK